MGSHPSSSTEQILAEERIVAALAAQLGVTFTPAPEKLRTLRLDAYGVVDDLPILVEVFAHVGRCKAGQSRKLSRDMTKLLVAENLLRAKCRKVVAVIDADAVAHFENGWDGAFARAFGIEPIVVRGLDELHGLLRAAQARQFR